MQAYAIADCAEVPDEGFYRRVGQLVDAGIDWIQLRAKHLDDRDVTTIAEKLQVLISKRARFVVNSRSDIAVGVGADGVHLPANGVPVDAARSVGRDFLVGRSCHNLTECRQAGEEGADYVLLGSIFTPRSKGAERRVTIEELKSAADLPTPVFALGGVSRENLSQLRGIPIEGVAAITLFMQDEPLPEIVKAVREL